MVSSAVCTARRYGELSTTSGRWSTGSPASHARRAPAWAAPVADSGTSASRSVMSSAVRPAASANSAATFAVLSPCRTTPSQDSSATLTLPLFNRRALRAR